MDPADRSVVDAATGAGARRRGGGRGRGPSLRWKLAASYAGFLVVAGAALLAVAFLVLRFIPDENLTVQGTGDFVPNRSDLIAELVPASLWALALLGVTGVAGGWWLAGRVLRPLERIAEAARRVEGGSLSHRVALPGRDDELSQLADTLDEMLERLERAFDEQRRFAANASHELRTPLAVTRTVLDVAAAAPQQPDIAETLRRLALTNDRAIATTESLLALARAQSGRMEHLPLDLTEVVDDVLSARRRGAGPTDEATHFDLSSAEVTGDTTLLTALVANLVQNAAAHGDPDHPQTWVRTRTTSDGCAELVVESSGPVLDPDLVRTLTEPFVRGATRVRSPRTAGGSGLGLSIVDAVARAHGADLRLAPRPGGGLVVTVRFPPT